jgi:Ca2+-binding RTX toxin-like protein
MFGFAGNDTLRGSSLADELNGQTGNDTLTGGAGSDDFFFRLGDGNDVITDFQHGLDHIHLHNYDVPDFAALHALMAQVGGDTVITFDPNNTVTLQNVAMTSLTAGDFLLN